MRRNLRERTAWQMISWMPVAGIVEMGIGNMGRGGVTEKRTTGITEGQGARPTKTIGAGIEPSDYVRFALFCLSVGCYYCFIVCLHHRERFKQLPFMRRLPAPCFLINLYVGVCRRIGWNGRAFWSKGYAGFAPLNTGGILCSSSLYTPNLNCMSPPQKEHC